MVVYFPVVHDAITPVGAEHRLLPFVGKILNGQAPVGKAHVAGHPGTSAIRPPVGELLAHGLQVVGWGGVEDAGDATHGKFRLCENQPRLPDSPITMLVSFFMFTSDAKSLWYKSVVFFLIEVILKLSKP